MSWNSKYKTRSNSPIKQKGGGFLQILRGMHAKPRDGGLNLRKLRVSLTKRSRVGYRVLPAIRSTINGQD
jgi:hypothetical protein